MSAARCLSTLGSLVLAGSLACAQTDGGPPIGTTGAALSWAARSPFGPDDPTANQSFGTSMDLDGDTFVTGAPSDFGPPAEAGAAYVFVRASGAWAQQAKLVASPRTAAARFGAQVAISGDTVAIASVDPAAIHVFTRTGTTWTEQPSIALPAGTEVAALALDGDTLVAGTPGLAAGPLVTAGGASVWIRNGSGAWTLEATLQASDPGADDRLGSAVALDGDTIVLGAFAADLAGQQDAGAAYVFVRSAGAWSEQQKLTASDARGSGWFGFALAIDGDTVLATGLFSSAGYAFVRAAGVWTEEARLPVAGASSSTEVGFSADLRGDVAILGSPNFSPGGLFQAGAAWTFVRSGGTWAPESTLGVPGAMRGDGLGWRVALTSSGAAALVTAPNQLRVAPDVRGVVHVFGRGVATGQACDPRLDCASGFCADGVCCATECGGDVDDCRACSVAAGSSADGECRPRAASVTCRASSGPCDAPELCTGASVECPEDAPPMCPMMDAGLPDASAAEDAGAAGLDAVSFDAAALDAAAADASPVVLADAAVLADASAQPDASIETPVEAESGCGCGAAGGARSIELGWAVVLAAFVARRRLRRSVG